MLHEWGYNMKPVIGIVSRPGIIFNKFDVQVMEETYKNVILDSGGLPVMITPPQMVSFDSIAPREVPRMTEQEKCDMNILLGMCDGLLTPGGMKSYEYDYYICKYALENNIPILGICNGMQIMARIDSDNRLIKDESGLHYGSDKIHKIKIENGTLLKEIMGKDNITVNSFHRYYVANGGISNVSAVSVNDNIIEAIENDNVDFYVGVQWHPEKIYFTDDSSKKLFKSFVDCARNKR